MKGSRFAVYYLPGRSEPWADFCTRWLGWDSVAACEVPPPVPGAHGWTETPRRYGLHATLKPPFRLAPGAGSEALEDAVAALAQREAPVQAEGLRLAPMGQFLALRPVDNEAAIAALAAACVRDLDSFRAPASSEEMARRQPARMSAAQARNLAQWGYPHVMDCFHFHLTLTGRLPATDRARAISLLASHLGPLLPRPFRLADIALCREDGAGRFHMVRRFPLTGAPTPATKETP